MSTTNCLQMANITGSAQPSRLRYRLRPYNARRDPGTLQTRWHSQGWTRKSCVICGKPRIQLHHAAYGSAPNLELAYLVPWCADHHRDFESNIWPRVRRVLPLSIATLAYVVNGDRFHQWAEWYDPWPAKPGVNREQLSFFDGKAA